MRLVLGTVLLAVPLHAPALSEKGRPGRRTSLVEIFDGRALLDGITSQEESGCSFRIGTLDEML